MTLSQALFILPIVLLFRLLTWAAFRETPVNAVSWSQKSSKWPHDLKRYDQESLLTFANTKDLHHDDFNKTLDNILKIRVPGTEGHRQVKEYIANSMKELGWHVEEDSFTSRTPAGRKPFTNIVATLNPNTCRQLVIACHYDSKFSKNNRFLGATDSAVPCSMMIHLAKVLHESLQDQKQKSEELSLQFIFFDGEEAFQQWTQTDSLYGSRHLAELWNRTPPTPGKNKCFRRGEPMVSRLDQMDVMVLLDLLGTANPRFYNFFSETNGIYSRLPGIEQEMNQLKMMEGHPPTSNTEYFDMRTSWSHVEDDHIPFMKRGVPIIHVIPSPFPHVWHKDSDNGDNLHHPTISNLNKIFRIFVSEYLHLDPEKHKSGKYYAK